MKSSQSSTLNKLLKGNPSANKRPARNLMFFPGTARFQKKIMKKATVNKDILEVQGGKGGDTLLTEGGGYI